MDSKDSKGHPDGRFHTLGGSADKDYTYIYIWRDIYGTCLGPSGLRKTPDKGSICKEGLCRWPCASFAKLGYSPLNPKP